MKIPASLKRFLLLTLFFMYFTGLATWFLTHWFQMAGAFGPEASPFRKLWLQVHSIISLWFIGLFGYLMHSHVLIAWRRRKKIWSGSVFTAILLGLMASVPFLFYASTDSVRDAAAWFHTYLGLAAILPFVIHYFLPTRD